MTPVAFRRRRRGRRASVSPAVVHGVIRHNGLVLDPDATRSGTATPSRSPTSSSGSSSPPRGRTGGSSRRDQLLDAVYGADEAEILDRTVDVHIGRLRDKLGDDADGPATSPRCAASAIAAAPRPGAPCDDRAGSPPGSRSRPSRRRASAIAILAVGVVLVGGQAFTDLMVEAGDSRRPRPGDVRPVGHAVVIAAVVVAALAAIGLAGRRSARMLARPLARGRRRRPPDRRGRLRRPRPARGPGGDRSASPTRSTRWPRRLEEQERMRRDFIANAAHELRTPLTNLQGYLEALRDGVIEPTAATYESLREEADRLVRLSRSLDALAEGDAGAARRCSSRPRPGRRTIRSARRRSPDAGARARPGSRSTVDVPDDLPARANPDQLAQVLGNLLSNAARYTPARRPGRASGPNGDPPTCSSSVANTGEGIPADDLPTRLRALLPGREVARPGARRRRHRAGDRQAAGRGGRRPGRRGVGRAARRASGSACRADGDRQRQHDDPPSPQQPTASPRRSRRDRATGSAGGARPTGRRHETARPGRTSWRARRSTSAPARARSRTRRSPRCRAGRRRPRRATAIASRRDRVGRAGAGAARRGRGRSSRRRPASTARPSRRSPTARRAGPAASRRSGSAPRGRPSGPRSRASRSARTRRPRPTIRVPRQPPSKTSPVRIDAARRERRAERLERRQRLAPERRPRGRPSARRRPPRPG